MNKLQYFALWSFLGFWVVLAGIFYKNFVSERKRTEFYRSYYSEYMECAKERKESEAEVRRILHDIEYCKEQIINNCQSLAPRWGCNPNFCEAIKKSPLQIRKQHQSLHRLQNLYA